MDISNEEAAKAFVDDLVKQWTDALFATDGEPRDEVEAKEREYIAEAALAERCVGAIDAIKALHPDRQRFSLPWEWIDRLHVERGAALGRKSEITEAKHRALAAQARADD